MAKLGDATIDVHVNMDEVRELEGVLTVDYDWVNVATLLGVAFIVGWLLASLLG